MSEQCLELKNVCKSFRDFTLNNISFTLPQGYIMGLVGPNGAGKTTTIQLILNMLEKDAGRIFQRFRAGADRPAPDSCRPAGAGGAGKAVRPGLHRGQTQPPGAGFWRFGA